MPWIIPISAIYLLCAAILVRMAWPYRQHLMAQRRQESLPPVLPAWIFDNSESPDGVVWYCPDCWLEWIRQGEHMYFEPDGVRQFCAAHLTSTLAHALNAQSTEKHA